MSDNNKIFDRFLIFLLNSEAGAKAPDIDAVPVIIFESARLKGWSDDPRDAGGATMCGVTLNTLRAWCARHRLPVPTKDILRNITFMNWKSVVRDLFWSLCRADEIVSPQLAYIIVDWVWASGPSVIRKVQRILGVNPDGIIGPRTLKAINEADQERLFLDIRNERIAFIDSICRSRPQNKVFRKGWLRRLDRIAWLEPYLRLQ